MLLVRALACALCLSLPALSVAPQRHPRHTAPRPPRSMSAAIRQVLASDPNFARAHIGIQIADSDTGKVLYALNDQQLFIPASNTKLLTTTAGFSILGPQWRTRTTVESAQPINAAGELDADLVLVGRGDPNLSGRVLPYNLKTERTLPALKPLETLADQLVAAGLKRVKGDVLGDDTWFAYERWGDSWGEDDLMWEFAAPVSALTVNDNVTYFTVTPAATAGERAQVAADPFEDDYVLDNHTTTVAATEPKHLALDRQPGTRIFKAWGQIPLGAPPETLALATDDPAAFAASALRNMLIARGVRVDGTFRANHTDPTSLPSYLPETIDHSLPQARPLDFTTSRQILATLESRPLGDDLTVINKVSQNLHVEILMRQLGRAASPFPNTPTGGSIWGGTNVVRRFLINQVGLAPDEFQYNDGSGMTPHNLVTPAALVKLLRWSRTQPWFPQFYNTLPVAGIDGTLAHRYNNTPSAGRIHAKTGSLNEVAALSGYATRVGGEPVTFSVLVNSEKVEQVAPRLIDSILRAVVESRSP